MRGGSAYDLIRISWSERGLMRPVFAVLAVGGLVISTLASYAFGLAEGGDIGSLVTIGTIAAACTLVVLRAVTRHAVAERWPTVRRLRIVGMSARRLRVALLTETAAIAVAAALVSAVLARYLVTPLLTPYLVSLEVVPAHTPARWRLGAVVVTVVGTGLVALGGTFGASLTLTRLEPADTSPPGPAAGSGGASRTAVYGLGLVAMAVCASFLLKAVLATRSDETAFLLGALLLICLMALLCGTWRGVVRGCSGVVNRLRRLPASAPALVSRRWRERQHQVTVVSATVIATMMAVFLGGYPTATDAMARHRLQDMIGERLVAQTTLTASEAGAQVLEGDGVVMAKGRAVLGNRSASTAVDGGQWGQSVTLLGGDGADDWLAALGATVRSPGAVVTRQEALRSGVVPGDELVLSGQDGSSVETTITDVVDMPSTFGDYLITDPTAVGFATGRVTALLGHTQEAREGWTVQPASVWIQALAPGSAVSDSGGAGTRETPLLVGAPLALCLTLAAAATATTVVARRPDLRMLERLGMPQWQRAGALARSVMVDTLCAGAVAAVVSMGLLALTIRPYAALIGIGPAVPWLQLSYYAAVPIAIWLVSTASALRFAVRRTPVAASEARG